MRELDENSDERWRESVTDGGTDEKGEIKMERV